MDDDAKTVEQLLKALEAERARNEQLEADAQGRAAGLDAMGCILWRARVVEVDGGLDWTTHVLNPNAAQRLLPLDLAPGQRWETAHLISVSPAQGAAQEAASEEAIRSGVGRYGQEVAWLDMYGSTKWFYEDVSVRAVGPEQWELCGVSTDVTEKKARELELHQAEEQRDALRAVLACAADGIIVVDAEGGFAEFNAAAEEILGIGPTGALPDRWAEVYGVYHADGTTRVPPDENPTVRALGGEHVDDWRGVIRNPQRPDGVRIAVSARPLVTDDGRVAGAVATFQDITERDRIAEALADANTELARKESHLREAQQLAAIGSWEWDLTNDTHSWSDELYSIYGVPLPDPAAEARPRLTDILHHADIETAERTLAQVIEERGILDAETRLLPRDGEVRHVRVRGRVECDAEGEPVRLVGTTQDITETKAAQAQLAEQLTFQQREQEIARTLYELSDIADITEAVFNGLQKLFDADVGIVCLRNEDETRAEGFMAFGIDGPPVTETSFDLRGAGVISEVMQTGSPVCIVIDRTDEYVPQSIVRRHDLNGPAAILPLRVRGKTIGFMGILRQEVAEQRPAFTPHDIERMTPLVADLALAVDNAQLYEQVREQANSFERVVSAARCLLWHGEVREQDGGYVWDFAPVSDAAAQSVFPVDVPEGEQWHSVLGTARLSEDNDAMNTRAFDAFRTGVSAYSQDYRAIDKHGIMHWLHEDVDIEPISPGRWRVVGVTTDVTEPRQAEEEVRRSEEHFRRIFEHGPLGMAIVGPGFTLMDVNDTLCGMLGYTRAELLARTIQAVTHPDDYESDLELGARVMRGEIPSYSIEKRYIRKDGAIVWGRLTGSAVHDADGTPLYGIGMVEDITQQKQDELLRQCLYDIGDAMHTAPDLETMCDSIYRSLLALIDAPGFAIALTVEGEIDTFDTVYLVWGGQVRPAKRSAVPGTRTATVARTRAPLCLTRTQCEQMAESGEIDPDMQDPSAYLGVPLELGGELIGVVFTWHAEEEAPYTERHVEIMSFAAEQIAVAIDRRRTQEDLVHERNLFQALMESSPDPIYFKDAERRFTRVSRSCAAAMGLDDAATAIGKTDNDLQSVGSDTYRREEERILRTGEALTDSLQHYPVPDGQDEWTLISKAPTRDAAGRINGLVGVNRTVTELIGIQEALRASETGRTQLMERMLTVQEEERARIARELHDQVGQELTSILLGLRVVEAAPSVEDARREIGELREVTANTLEDVRQIAFEMRPSSLEDLGVGPALERDLAIMGQGAGFTPTFRFYNPDDLSLTTAVELGIYRIVHSALTNIARHAGAKNVNVTVQVESSEVSVLVQDDGVGFDAEAVMAGPVEGRFGILSMQERAKIVDGVVSVDSELGVGTTILVRIPRRADDTPVVD